MTWLVEHRAFVVEEFIRNSGSVIATQRAFRIRFQLGRHDCVPDRKTIQLWVCNFRQTGSALKRKPTGRPRTATTPENVARVRQSIQQSPRHSARKHSAALGLSDRSVRRILHRELGMHPFITKDAEMGSHTETAANSDDRAVVPCCEHVSIDVKNEPVDWHLLQPECMLGHAVPTAGGADHLGADCKPTPAAHGVAGSGFEWCGQGSEEVCDGLEEQMQANNGVQIPAVKTEPTDMTQAEQSGAYCCAPNVRSDGVKQERPDSAGCGVPASHAPGLNFGVAAAGGTLVRAVPAQGAGAVKKLKTVSSSQETHHSTIKTEVIYVKSEVPDGEVDNGSTQQEVTPPMFEACSSKLRCPGNNEEVEGVSANELVRHGDVLTTPDNLCT